MGVLLMKILRLELNEDVTPVVVTAELTIEEAGWIAERGGEETGGPGAGMYGILSAGVFNPFWSDGVSDYLRGAEGSRS
jgi:hypothetical protein